MQAEFFQAMEGANHWQHPAFHAYFPGNTHPGVLLGDIFVTSPLSPDTSLCDETDINSMQELEINLLNEIGEFFKVP